MTKTLRTLQTKPAIHRILLIEPASSFQKWHLGGEVIGLNDFNWITTTSKTDVIGTTVCARSIQPESVHKTTNFLTHLGEAALQLRERRFVDRRRGCFTTRKLELDRV